METKYLGKRHIAALLAGLLGSLAVSVGLTWHQAAVSGRFTEDHLTLLVYVTAACVYLLGKVMCEWLEKRASFTGLSKPLHMVAGLTLGIYLMDPLFLAYFGVKFTALAGDSLGMIPLSVVYCCISMAFCGGITWVLKKVPGIRKLL